MHRANTHPCAFTSHCRLRVFLPLALKSKVDDRVTKRRFYADLASTSPPQKCLYQVLELTPGADRRSIKSSYYRLSKKYHPDVSARPESRELFIAVSDAYAILGNDEKRQQYDQSRVRGSSQHLGRHRSRQPSSRTYGVYDPHMATNNVFKDSSKFNYNVHQWEHYGREESSAKSNRTMRNTRLDQRRYARQQQEWDEWRTELTRHRSNTQWSWTVGVALGVVSCVFVYIHHY